MPDTSIIGLGLSQQGRHLGISERELRRIAADAAIADAGIDRNDIDGVITVGSDFTDLRYMGLDPDFCFSMQAGGATPVCSVLMAAGAIATGQAETVLCVYGEAFTSPTLDRLQPNHGDADRLDIRSVSYGYPFLFGLVGPASVYALAARRHMSLYGTTEDHLGQVAVVERAYASIRPDSMGYGDPITLEDHHNSRQIVDPFRLLDCSRPTDGGAAVIVTSKERAKNARARSVDILGAGTAHGVGTWWTKEMFESMNAARSAERAFGQAGITAADIDTAQLYAPFTIAVLMQLEEYGFCGKGESGDFVMSGATELGGAIPTNTGGGQLSGFYATGFTPLSEGILQARGEAPSSQVPDAELCLVSGSGGNGGIQGSWAHASLVLGPSR